MTNNIHLTELRAKIARERYLDAKHDNPPVTPGVLDQLRREHEHTRAEHARAVLACVGRRRIFDR